MDSFEEEQRLVQMVHDFIESSSDQSQPPNSHAISTSPCDQSNNFTLQEILESVTKEESRVYESVVKHMRSKRGKSYDNISSLKKWLVMRLKMDGFHASLCQTSCVTSFGSPAGDYEYIDITMNKHDGDGDNYTKGSERDTCNTNSSTRLIVDIEFKSQFEVARPTASYKSLTDMLPSFFIGTEEKLNTIISLLCSAAKQSLKESGLHLPPWRTSSYMQSKWLSGSRKVVTSATSEGSNGRDHADKMRNSRGGIGSWTPPINVNPKRRFLSGGGIGLLSSQFAKMSINCC